MKVFLKYSFIMEPLDEWRSRDDFDADLGRFFASKQLNAEVVKTGIEDLPDMERMIYLSKIEQVIPAIPQTNSPKKQLKSMEVKDVNPKN